MIIATFSIKRKIVIDRNWFFYAKSWKSHFQFFSFLVFNFRGCFISFAFSFFYLL